MIKEYKILIGLEEIAGYNSNLKKGFKKLGIDCTFIDLTYHSFQYGGDDKPNIFVKMYRCVLHQRIKHDSGILKIPFFIILMLLRILIFLWAIINYNVFILTGGSSFFRHNGHYFDFPLLKLLNKKIIISSFGSEERPPYINWSASRINGNNDMGLYKKKTDMIKKRVAAIDRYSNYIVTHPGYAHFHQKNFIKGLAIGIPFNASNLNFSASNQNNTIGTKPTKSVRILHSPSDPIGKGSAHIKKAISTLKEKGYLINFIEITGKPHQEVIKELQSCDFIVDQVYSDTPMAVFATEAAWFGKPAIVGGYYSGYIHNHYSQEQIPPSIYCHPDEITPAIERLVVDKEFRLNLGKKAHNFVRTTWSAEQVAKRYMQIIEGTIPEECMFDPNDIRYVQGYGMPEPQSKEIIRNMIEQYGIESLCLSDKPELEQRFREYAYDVRESK